MASGETVAFEGSRSASFPSAWVESLAPWCVQEAMVSQRAFRPWTCTRQYPRSGAARVTPPKLKARRTFHQMMSEARVEGQDGMANPGNTETPAGAEWRSTRTCE